MGWRASTRARDRMREGRRVMRDWGRYENAIIVDSSDGLYDEKAEAVIYNISDRQACWWRRHAFVNASPQWEAIRYTDHALVSVPLEGLGAGGGYGGIRFCRRCKLIDCIHRWSSEVTYRVMRTEFNLTGYVVGTCERCGRRVLLNSFGCSNPDPRAVALIDEVASELGKPRVSRRTEEMTLPGYGNGYGSGYVIEFPAQVSQVLKLHGEPEARAYVEEIFRCGSMRTDYALLGLVPPSSSVRP